MLKIRRDATQDEVKRAYRRLARELHPDVNPDPETQERFKEITQAYEVLSDTDKRRMYDMGVDPFAASTAGAGGGPLRAGVAPPDNPLAQLFCAGGGGAGPGRCGACSTPLNALLDVFCGGGGGGPGSRGPRSRAQRGRNATIR